MPSVELSVAELKYLARMNGENIFVMQAMEKKSGTVFPDLPLARRIEDKLTALFPPGLPDPLADLKAAREKIAWQPRNAKAGIKR